MKNKNNAFTLFVVVVVIAVFLSISICVLSMAININKISSHKIQFIGRSYMLKSSLIYPEKILKKYYEEAFNRSVLSLKNKYKNYNQEDLEFYIEDIQKDYKRLIKDDLYFINQIRIYIDINKINVDQCVFRVTEFKLKDTNNISIKIESKFDSRDYINSHTAVYIIHLVNFSVDDIYNIVNGDIDLLWEKYKDNVIKEKDYVEHE